jgi:DNA (cytosine-5)-methyltransferase 1
LKYFEMLGPGQYWKHLPSEKIQQEAMGASYLSGGGKTGFYRRLAWDTPAPTLVTHPAMPATELGHPTKNRPLTIEEYKRIQQFPDEWEIEGNILNQYKQIGNAVPIGLGEALGKTILNNLQGKKTIDKYRNFQYSRYKNTDDLSWKASYRESVRKAKFDLMQLAFPN